MSGSLSGALPQDWSAQNLIEFLTAVAGCRERLTAAQTAVDRVTEALEAEVALVVVDGEVLASVGLRDATAVRAALETIQSGRPVNEVVTDSGQALPAAVAPLGTAGALLVARAGAPLDAVETGALRGLAGILQLVLATVDLVETERGLRAQQEQRAQQIAGLLTDLQQRQTLLERLSRIQRSISARVSLQQVLDAVSAAAVELTGDDMGSVRLLDDEDPSMLRLVSSYGMGVELHDSISIASQGQGVSGQAFLAGRLVVDHAYGDRAYDDQQCRPELLRQGISAAMAAPVRAEGSVVGCLTVGSRRPGRRYSELEQEVVTALAEHASLALTDARTVEALHRSLAGAMHRAAHDELTGLANRQQFLERLDAALTRADAAPEAGAVAVLFIDLDNFKLVNDSLGHATGDALLVHVARRLEGAVRGDDCVARLGGDEFAVLLERCEDDHRPRAVAERLAAVLRRPFDLDGREFLVTGSVGIALRSGTESVSAMLRHADVAMYAAKRLEGSAVAVFQESMTAAVLERIELEADLRRALGRDELTVHFQPLVSTSDRVTVGFEALARWTHPERGPVSPAAFVPLAEETGLIVGVDRRVLAEGCAQVRRWQQSLDLPHLTLSVNISPRHLRRDDFVPSVVQVLASTGFPPHCLTLEITEGALLDDTVETQRTLSELKELGIRVSIDDFGTGYSALSYLRRFPVDELKIDKSFVDGLDSGVGDSRLVEAILQIARTLGLHVVAEGVESEAQLDLLLEMGCATAQGYLFARPGTAETVAALLPAAVRAG